MPLAHHFSCFAEQKFELWRICHGEGWSCVASFVCGSCGAEKRLGGNTKSCNWTLREPSYKPVTVSRAKITLSYVSSSTTHTLRILGFKTEAYVWEGLLRLHQTLLNQKLSLSLSTKTSLLSLNHLISLLSSRPHSSSNPHQHLAAVFPSIQSFFCHSQQICYPYWAFFFLL